MIRRYLSSEVKQRIQVNPINSAIAAAILHEEKRQRGAKSPLLIPSRMRIQITLKRFMKFLWNFY